MRSRTLYLAGLAIVTVAIASLLFVAATGIPGGHATEPIVVAAEFRPMPDGAAAFSESSPAPFDVRTSVIEGNTQFALDLYDRLSDQPGNQFFSPVSISTALAMTYAGARGQTAEEMARTLHFSVPPAQLHAVMGNLRNRPAGADSAYKLRIANAMWTQKGKRLLPEFLAVMQRDYGGGLREADFIQAPEAARREINAWVEEQTNYKIRDVVPSGKINQLTRLVLANAIYFKGAWLYRFSKEKTLPAEFHVGAGTTVTTPMMTLLRRFHCLSADNYQMLELEYAGKQISMVIVLPRKVDGLRHLERSITQETLMADMARLEPRTVRVYLPRFRFTQAFDLSQTLGAMGMHSAFSPGAADFAGIDGGEPGSLFIGSVLHKAFVEVNEEGTEAAAATAVVGETSVSVRETFRADHPFLFLIRDLRTGSILFMGRVANPVSNHGGV